MAGYAVTFSVIDQATAKINQINKSIQGLKAPLEAQQKALLKFADVSGLSKLAGGFKSVASSAVSAAEAMTSMVPAMGALVGAASLGGLVKLVNQFASLGDELVKTGMVLEETPERLYGVAQAMRYFGGNADDAINSLKALKDVIYDAALGAAPRAAYMFQMLGVKTIDANKNFRDVIDVQKDLFAGFDRMKNPIDRQRAAMIAGGKAMAETYLQYKATGATLDEWYQKQKDMQTLTQEQVKTMQNYERAIGPLNAAFYNLGTNLATAVAPAMTEAANALAKWIAQNPDKINAAMKEIGKDLKWVADNLDTIKTTAEIVGGIFVTLWGVRAVSSVLALMAQVKALNSAISLGPLGLLLGAGAGAYKLGRDIVKGAPEAPGEWSINKWLNPAYWINKATGGPGSAPAAAPTEGAPAAGGPAAPGGAAAPGGPPAGVAPGQPYGYAPIAPPTPAARPQGAAGPGGGELGSPLGPGGGAGYASIAAQRAPLLDEVNRDPATKKLMMQMMATEGGGAATLEALFNRTAMIRQKIPGYSIKDELNSGFYGPIKRGVAQQRDITPGEAAGFQKTIDQVAGGSNIIQGRTNQGLPTDPGAGAAGGVSVPGNSQVYNYWSGQRQGVGFGLSASAAFAKQQQSLATEASPPHTPGGGGAGDLIDQMAVNAGTRGAAVRQFLKDPKGVLEHDPDLGNWCAEYMNAYLNKLGVPHPNTTLMAKSYLAFGHQIDKEQLQRGDILLNKDLSPHRAHVGVATGRTWLNTPGHKEGEVEEYSSNSIVNGKLTNLPGYRWRSDVNARTSPELRAAEAAGLQPQGAPGTMLAGRAPTGTVDVNIRHTNAPAGTSTIAYATGGGINLNPPRIEHQKMSDTI